MKELSIAAIVLSIGLATFFAIGDGQIGEPESDAGYAALAKRVTRLETQIIPLLDLDWKWDTLRKRSIFILWPEEKKLTESDTFKFNPKP